MTFRASLSDRFAGGRLMAAFPDDGGLSAKHAIEQLRLYQAVSAAVNSSLILEDIFESLGDVLQGFIPYETLIIAILDDSQNGIKLWVAMDQSGQLTMTSDANPFVGNDALMMHVLSTRLPVTLSGFQSSPFRQSLLFEPIQSESSVGQLPAAEAGIILPLVNKGIVVGFLALHVNPETPAPHRKRPHALKAIERMLIHIADPIAVAVENAKLYWQTQAQASRAFLLNRLTQAIRQSLDIDQMLETAVLELGQVLGVSRCLIQYSDMSEVSPVPLQSKTLAQEISEASSDAGGQAPLSHTPPIHTLHTFIYQVPGVPAFNPQGTVDDLQLEQAVFQIRKPTRPSPFADKTPILNPFILNDVQDCPPQLLKEAKPLFERYRIQSMAVFPILIREQLVGTITLHQCNTARPWLSEDIELMDAMCEHLGVALQQAELFAQREEQNHKLEVALEELQHAQMNLIQSEKMSVLGQFVAGIAHEVNTPLGVIAGNNATIMRVLQQVSQNHPDPKLSRALDLLELNRQASERIDDTIRSLRNFARLDESERKVVDLHEGIESTLHLLQATLKSNIVVNRSYGDNIPPLPCYPGLLNQVFMNLIMNASHALMDRLAEQQDPPTLTIKTLYSEAEQAWHICFSDNGKGISEQHLKRIFDPGFTTKGVGVGTGMGLALCYRIIEKHGGYITVESRQGVGTTFTIILK
ncbi:MAG: ATP-binding protein [Vampirovibrionales bacterium]|nr:ATP-binding protein [Vampirovibrionales bacterium]